MTGQVKRDWEDGSHGSSRGSSVETKTGRLTVNTLGSSVKAAWKIVRSV